MAEKWIDVSAHNGVIDWPRVKASGVDGVVIRVGYGDDVSQQDKRFAENIEGARAAGLKVAVYWFHYADSVSDMLKEWECCRQIILPYREQICFVVSDYEYDSYNYYCRVHGNAPTNELINQMVMAFRGAAKADGWKTAIYTNNDYRRNIFTPQTLSAFDLRWFAYYSGKSTVPCGMQQTGSTGHVPGISGNVDMDVAFTSFGVATVPVASSPRVAAFYRVRADGRWLPEVQDTTDFAGIAGKPITDVAMRVSAGTIKYRVHVKGADWLPWVTGCDINNPNGYAGDGREIDAVQAIYYTPEALKPSKCAKYRIAPVGGGYYGWQLDNQTTGGQDGYAGTFGKTIDHLQMCIE